MEEDRGRRGKGRREREEEDKEEDEKEKKLKEGKERRRKKGEGIGEDKKVNDEMFRKQTINKSVRRLSIEKWEELKLFKKRKSG